MAALLCPAAIRTSAACSVSSMQRIGFFSRRAVPWAALAWMLAFPRPEAARPLPAARAEIVLDATGGLHFRVTGLPARQGSAASWVERWREQFRVYVDNGRTAASQAPELPPLLGSYHAEDGVLVFRPRFPLQPGLRYRAVLGKSGEGQPLVHFFDLPTEHIEPMTHVAAVYPSADLLPENLLKFYLHFSAPMSRGEVYQRTRLLDHSGKPVELAFLELEQELWDAEGKRLTILFDPGRIKRGLVPHEEMGLAMRQGDRYRLVIDQGWPDAEGRPMREDFEKSFQAGPADHEPPNIENWKVFPPKSGTLDSLAVEFREPLDHALQRRLIQVVTTARIPLEGFITVDRNETRWTFTPRQPWRAGSYYLEAGTALEDLAGNSLDRPFEVDVFNRVEERILRATRSLRFQIDP